MARIFLAAICLMCALMACSGAAKTPTPRPAVASATATPAGLFIDATQFVLRSHAQVDGILGQPKKTTTVSPGEIEYVPGGGTSRIYRPATSPYDVEIVFDTNGLSRGVILLSTVPEIVPCAQAWKLVAKLGVIVPSKADSEAPMARRWVKQNGYSVYVACPNPSGNVSVVQVWRVP